TAPFPFQQRSGLSSLTTRPDYQWPQVGIDTGTNAGFTADDKAAKNGRRCNVFRSANLSRFYSVPSRAFRFLRKPRWHTRTRWWDRLRWTNLSCWGTPRRQARRHTRGLRIRVRLYRTMRFFLDRSTRT